MKIKRRQVLDVGDVIFLVNNVLIILENTTAIKKINRRVKPETGTEKRFL